MSSTGRRSRGFFLFVVSNAELRFPFFFLRTADSTSPPPSVCGTSPSVKISEGRRFRSFSYVGGILRISDVTSCPPFLLSTFFPVPPIVMAVAAYCRNWSAFPSDGVPPFFPLVEHDPSLHSLIPLMLRSPFRSFNVFPFVMRPRRPSQLLVVPFARYRAFFPPPPPR